MLQLQRQLLSQLMRGDTETSASIQTQICIHQEAIRSLKSQMNRLSNISSLPPEVMSKIFAVLALPERVPGARGEWIVVTHVCSHWRQVALDYSSLWTYIDISRPGQAVEFMHRSKQTSLAACLSFGHEVYRHGIMHSLLKLNAAWLALEKLTRIHDLHIVGTSVYDFSPFLSLLADRPAPRLKRLRVSCLLSYIRFSAPLFKNEAPSLHSISLQACGVTLDGSIFRGLTHLDLTDMQKEDQPTMSRLLRVLESCTKIETLVLISMGPTCDICMDDIPLKPYLDMPYLRQLVITMEAATWAKLLCHLIIPEDVDWSITCLRYPIRAPIPALPISSVTKPQFRKMSAEIDSHGILARVGPWDPSFSHFDPLERTDHKLRLTWQTPIGRGLRLDDAITALGALVDNGIWMHVSIFQLHLNVTDYISSKESWPALLSSMPYLQTLQITIQADHVTDTEEALAIALCGTLVGAVDEQFLCPILCQVKLIGFDLWKWVVCFPKFQRSVSIRKAAGLSIYELHIVDSTGLESNVDMVGLRTWDGVEQVEDEGQDNDDGGIAEEGNDNEVEDGDDEDEESDDKIHDDEEASSDDYGDADDEDVHQNVNQATA